MLGRIQVHVPERQVPTDLLEGALQGALEQVARPLDASDPRRFYLDDDHWICPYCLSVCEIGSDSDYGRRSEEHLHIMHACSASHRGAGSLQPVSRLRLRAVEVVLAELVHQRAAWRVFTSQGEWVDPITLQPVASIGDLDQPSIVLMARHCAQTVPAHCRVSHDLPAVQARRDAIDRQRGHTFEGGRLEEFRRSVSASDLSLEDESTQTRILESLPARELSVARVTERRFHTRFGCLDFCGTAPSTSQGSRREFVHQLPVDAERRLVVVGGVISGSDSLAAECRMAVDMLVEEYTQPAALLQAVARDLSDECGPDDRLSLQIFRFNWMLGTVLWAAAGGGLIAWSERRGDTAPVHLGGAPIAADRVPLAQGHLELDSGDRLLCCGWGHVPHLCTDQTVAGRLMHSLARSRHDDRPFACLDAINTTLREGRSVEDPISLALLSHIAPITLDG